MAKRYITSFYIIITLKAYFLIGIFKNYLYDNVTTGYLIEDSMGIHDVKIGMQER